MKKFILFLFLIIIIGIPAYIYTSSTFERIPPKVEIDHSEYWNLRDKLQVNISDNTGIKYYRIVMINDSKSKVLKEKTLQHPIKTINYDIKLPEFYQAKGDITIKVVAVDDSKWHYFAGNEVKKSFTFKVDTISPVAEVINNNYAMKRGGSGIAIVKVFDKHLKSAYIKISERDNPNVFKKFKLTPFYKQNYYISLLAWPYNYKTFSADLIVTDEAGNISQAHIPIRWRKSKYSKPKIKITDNFVKTIDVPLLQKAGLNIPSNLADIFNMANETLRKINETHLYKITDVVLDKKVDSLNIKPFRPMKGYTKEASYGEMRSYYLDGKKISFAIHKGVDLASYRNAKIYASNIGKVIFEGFVGIYGNTLAVYHKLGLVSTYSHCSSFDVGMGQQVYRGEVIAHTGSTGAVFGDHLHFGTYVQGIPVEPLEWMDSHWIRDNITSIIIKAKRMINR